MPNDKPEPLAAILAEIRDFCSGWSEDVDVTVKVGLIYGWKCRIEAAAERERAMLDGNIARVRELEAMLDGAANTVLGCAIKQKQSTPGNAAVMREALKESTALLAVVRGDEYEENITRQISRNTAALSAPARNCDRFNNATEAGLAYRNLVLARAGRVVDIDENTFFAHLANWLFAPAEGGKE